MIVVFGMFSMFRFYVCFDVLLLLSLFFEGRSFVCVFCCCVASWSVCLPCIDVLLLLSLSLCCLLGDIVCVCLYVSCVCCMVLYACLRVCYC